MPFYVPYALLNLGVPDSTIGSFLAVVALSGVISTALWGHVGEKYGVRWILIGMSAFGCVPPLVAISIPLLPHPWQIPSYFLIFAINGVSVNGMMVGFMTYMLNVAPPLTRPSYLGFMNTLLFPFSFVTVLGGIVVSWIGYQGVFSISLGLSLLAFTMTTRLEEVFYKEEIQSDDEIM
jgi:MFS family permease